MFRSIVRTMAVVAVAGLVAGGCSGGDDGADAPAADADAPATDEGGGAGGGDQPALEEVVLGDLDAPAAEAAAERAVDVLGDEALGAVAAALSNGYTAQQVITAVNGDDLGTDGTIEGVDPPGPPSDALLIAWGGGSGTGPSSGPAGYRIQLLAAGGRLQATTLRDAMLEVGAAISPDDPRRGAVLFLLALAEQGYGPEQIAEFLGAPDLFELRAVSRPGSGATCMVIFDATAGGPVLPLTPSVSSVTCQRLVAEATGSEADDVVYAEGSLTGGAITDGPTIESVLTNVARFRLLPGEDRVSGEATVVRRAVLPRDDCFDQEVSPLELVFTGHFADEDRTRVEGTFTYRVAPEAFVDEGDCNDPPTSWGSGGGTWSATLDDRALAGELTVANGSFGTNEFRAPVVR